MDVFSRDEFAAMLAALLVQETAYKRAMRSAKTDAVRDAYAIEVASIEALVVRVRNFLK